MKFSLVIPFHKDVQKLVPTLQRVRHEGFVQGVTEVLLCHNGPALSPEAHEFVKSLVFEGVRLLHTDEKGIGAGYRLGIENAKSDFVILSASDLPFGWTDLESFKKVPACDFAIGSKAHPQSEVGSISLRRRLASIAFFILRKVLLGEETPEDSQGSLIVKTDLARQLVKDCLYNNYLFSLEMATFHLHRGGRALEVPVVLENNDGESSVSIFRDGWQMLKDLLRLRRRLDDI